MASLEVEQSATGGVAGALIVDNSIQINRQLLLKLQILIYVMDVRWMQ